MKRNELSTCIAWAGYVNLEFQEWKDGCGDSTYVDWESLDRKVFDIVLLMKQNICMGNSRFQIMLITRPPCL